MSNKIFHVVVTYFISNLKITSDYFILKTYIYKIKYYEFENIEYHRKTIEKAILY